MNAKTFWDALTPEWRAFISTQFPSLSHLTVTGKWEKLGWQESFLRHDIENYAKLFRGEIPRDTDLRRFRRRKRKVSNVVICY